MNSVYSVYIVWFIEKFFRNEITERQTGRQIDINDYWLMKSI